MLNHLIAILLQKEHLRCCKSFKAAIHTIKHYITISAEICIRNVKISLEIFHKMLGGMKTISAKKECSNLLLNFLPSSACVPDNYVNYVWAILPPVQVSREDGDYMQVRHHPHTLTPTTFNEGNYLKRVNTMGMFLLAFSFEWFAPNDFCDLNTTAFNW